MRDSYHEELDAINASLVEMANSVGSAMSTATTALLDADHNPLERKNIKFLQTRDQSKALNDVPGPGIVVAGSGMANGGRIRHHMLNRISKNHLLRGVVVVDRWRSDTDIGGKVFSGGLRPGRSRGMRVLVKELR